MCCHSNIAFSEANRKQVKRRLFRLRMTGVGSCGNLRNQDTFNFTLNVWHGCESLRQFSWWINIKYIFENQWKWKCLLILIKPVSSYSLLVQKLLTSVKAMVRNSLVRTDCATYLGIRLVSRLTWNKYFSGLADNGMSRY